jgi:hypothetical protein
MRLVVGCLLLLGAAQAAAQGWPDRTVLDLGALPLLDPAGRQVYAQRFVLGNLPRVFAIAANGKYGAQWGAGSVEEMRDAALASCSAKGGTACAVYAEDLDVVWKGRKPAPRPRPPGLLVGDGRYGFIPDPRFFWLGPQAAAGVVVFAHGYSQSGGDPRGAQPPPYLRAFNNAGFDVVRFDRDPAWDVRRDEVADWLRAGLAELRRRGWRRIVAAGQSRGAWNILQGLDTPGIADTAIAVSPAASGLDAGRQILLGNTALWTITGDARAATTRVAFVQFLDDPYYTDAERRVDTIGRLRDRVADLLVIDRPDGITGHSGGNTSVFAERFGACLLRFATAPRPQAAC